MAKKIALGKGIASLIQETPNELLRANLGFEDKTENTQEQSQGSMMAPIEKIIANPNQPRKIFKEKELNELSMSIKENGILQPLVVAQAEKGYELIAGERRLRAAKLANLTHVPIIIKKATDKDKMVMAIIENIQRANLNCVEEALAYYQIMNEYELTQDQLAKQLGKERSTIANFLRLLKLPRIVIDMLQKEELTFGHGKVLAGNKDREHVIVCAKLAISENLSVRELEKILKKPVKEAVEKKKDKKEDYHLENLSEKLMQKTGYHFSIKEKKNGTGQIVIHYNNPDEFNEVYDFLLSNK